MLETPQHRSVLPHRGALTIRLPGSAGAPHMDVQGRSQCMSEMDVVVGRSRFWKWTPVVQGV
jgi:hypothetical protein